MELQVGHFTRAFRLLSDGRRRDIKLRKISYGFRDIVQDFIDSRSTGAMIRPMYFYYQIKKSDLNYIRYYILESGRGDVMLSEMSGSIHDKDITFRKVGAHGPRYRVLIPQLDNIVTSMVRGGESLEDARYRVGRDLARVAGGREVKGEYAEEDLDLLVTTGVILAVDMARERRAKRYIASHFARKDIGFREKLRLYAGSSGSGRTIRYRGEEIALSSLGVRGLREIGGFEGDAGDMSDYSDEELAPRALFPEGGEAHSDEFKGGGSSTPDIDSGSATDFDSLEDDGARSVEEDNIFSQSSNDSVGVDVPAPEEALTVGAADERRVPPSPYTRQKRRATSRDLRKEVLQELDTNTLLELKRGRKNMEGEYLRKESALGVSARTRSKKKNTKRSR